MHGLPETFFARQDESPDEDFYREPRLTTHIDDATIDALTTFYREVLSPSDRVCDLMSSWISHLPDDVNYNRVVGLGMNEAELRRNPRLDELVVRNLNEDPHLPWPDGHFDALLIAVSVQYLTRPFEVFLEIGRVLSPGGRCIVAMSHRLFPTKAIYAFHVLAPQERCRLVGSYMELAGVFKSIQAFDRSPPNADPLWIVVGTKSRAE
ncbi:MAG: methyltransferase domain-containing protein [Pseudomonadales bacterium]|nr:methyltransferase domain-containing protein [Pseudomonadales bacterium]